MKLQSKILLLLIPVIMISMITLGWYAHRQLQLIAQDKTFDQMSLLLKQTKSLHDAKINTTRSNIELFTNSSLIKRYLRADNLQDRFTLIQPSLLQLFASYQKAFPQYYDIRILLPDGSEDTRSSLSSTIDANALDPDLFLEISSSPNDIYTCYFWNQETNNFSLLMAKRINLTDEYYEPTLAIPRLRGYLIMFADLNTLRQQIIKERVGEQGFIFMTDAQGRIIVHPDQSKQTSLLPTELFIQLLKITENDGYIKGVYQQQNYFFKGKQVEKDLFVFAALPEIEIINASRQLASLLASILLLTIIVISILLFILLKFLIVEPISNLKNAAKDIASGKLAVTIASNSNDEVGDLAQSFNEMSECLQQSNEQIYHLAYHDSLTGLPNRRMFLERLAGTLERAKVDKQQFALLFLDLDDFKRVNDTLGHDVGDELLKEFSQRLIACLRVDDCLASFESDDSAACSVSRLGGDEFIFLLQDITSSDTPSSVAKRILDIAIQPFVIRNHEFHIGTSIGITLYPEDGDSIELLIKNADIAMYCAKAKGKNNFQFFQPIMNIEVMEQFDMENALRKAIPDQQLLLYYQPKIESKTGALVGVEALVRWQHPILGLLGPEQFIPLAETTGLIEPLGLWVMKEACQQNKQWQEQGFKPISVAVNISNRQFDKHDLLIMVQTTLRQTGLAPQYLELELTETSIMQAEDSAIDTLMAIKNLGVKIVMDDFGTGYSSLNTLRRFPIDCLKIDQCFIKNIASNADDAAIVLAIISMSKSLSIQVVAEGVENPEQLQVLRQQNCDLIQGFFVSKPISSDKMEKWLGARLGLLRGASVKTVL